MEQNVFDSESQSDMSFTVQKGTEMIHREVKGGTKTNRQLKENQSEFSGEVRSLGNTSTEGFGEETLTTHTRRKSALHVVQHRLHQQ